MDRKSLKINCLQYGLLALGFMICIPDMLTGDAGFFMIAGILVMFASPIIGIVSLLKGNHNEEDH